MSISGKHQRIWLVGFMGSGKTSLSNLLSKELNLEYLDSDLEIERIHKMPAARIIQCRGEDYFRVLERQLFFQVIHSQTAIIATGGGFPLYYNSMTELNDYGLTIFLEASWHTLWERIQNDPVKRPLASSEPSFRSLYEKRLFQYKNASLHVNVEKPLKDCLKEVMNRLEKMV